MVADPQPNPRTRVRRSRAWLKFVGLMLTCLMASIGAYLAAVALAAVFEFEIGDRSIAYFEILNRWLEPGSRVLGPWDRLSVIITNLAPMGAVALVLGVDHARRAGWASGFPRPAVQWKLLIAGLASTGFVWMAALVVLDRLAHQAPGVVGTAWNPALAETWWLYALAVIPVVTLGAIAEEAIFRGALPTRLRGLGLAPAAAVLLSSACFVAVHNTSDPMRIIQLAIGAHVAWNLAVYTWNARTLDVLNGMRPEGLDGYSTREWLVLIVMAGAPALVAEVIVRRRQARLT